MMSLKRMTVAMAMAGVATVALANGGFFGAEGERSAIERAHAAYLKDDMPSMSSALREALADPSADQLVRTNAYDLLNRAFREHKGKLTSDWAPPPGVSNLKFAHVRKAKQDGVAYKANFAGHMDAADTLSQVQLVKFPNDVVLDRRAGVGEWESAPEETGGGFYFGLDSEDREAPLADGLYIIRFVLASGLSSEGWFVMSDLTSSATPSVHAPAYGETVTSAQPTITWDDFRSPELSPDERRVMRVNVSRVTDVSPYWAPVWGLSSQGATQTSATVGLEPDADGPESSLANGEYWLSVSFYEQRMFGDLKLRRASRTSRPFRVAIP